VYVAPRGTMDILPEDQPYWFYVYDTIREVVQLYDYQRLDIPVFEETGLYIRGVGEGTDIVDKEMYSFQDKGGRDITLRPEFTAGIMRSYIEHGMRTRPQPVRVYSTGPVFRYERVQAGRYRQLFFAMRGSRPAGTVNTRSSTSSVSAPAIRQRTWK